jgi:hypothetical protein
MADSGMRRHRKPNSRIDTMNIFTGFLISAIAQLLSEFDF